MAFKLTVDFKKLALVVQTDATEPTTTFIHAKSSVTYQFMQASSAYELLSLSDISLDPDTKNLYFSAQFSSPHALTVTASDAISSVNTSLGKADSPVIEELLAKAIGKATSDTATLSENSTRVMDYVRSYSDSYAFSDSDVRSVTLPKTETVTFSESSVNSVSLAKTETTTLSESSSLLVSVPQSESITLAEAFSRVVSFARTFADAFTLDDVASGTDVLKTDTSASKSNIVGITESLAQSISKSPSGETVSVSEAFAYSASLPASDSVSVAESSSSSFSSPKSESVSLADLLSSLSFSKSLSDNATISESINVLLILGASSLLNATAFNVSTLNE